jgi:hypothetical protein
MSSFSAAALASSLPASFDTHEAEDPINNETQSVISSDTLSDGAFRRVAETVKI